jgi:hypothetical protein
MTHRHEVIFWLFTLFSLSTVVIWIRTATVKETYHFVQQQRELKAMQQELQAARVHWLKLTAPKRLDSLAERLHLAPPRLSQVLKYEPDKATLNASLNASLKNGERVPR